MLWLMVKMLNWYRDGRAAVIRFMFWMYATQAWLRGKISSEWIYACLALAYLPMAFKLPAVYGPVVALYALAALKKK